jgi:hypothetical protein
MEFQLVVATLAGTFAGVGTVILVATQAPPTATLACLWGSGLLAFASYGGALGAARRYGNQVKVAVDLYRLSLLEQLGLPTGEAQDAAQQRAAYTSLAIWWYRNVPPAAQAEPAADGTENADEPQPPSEVSGGRLAPSLHTIAAAAAATASLVILLLAL